MALHRHTSSHQEIALSIDVKSPVYLVLQNQKFFCKLNIYVFVCDKTLQKCYFAFLAAGDNQWNREIFARSIFAIGQKFSKTQKLFYLPEYTYSTNVGL